MSSKSLITSALTSALTITLIAATDAKAQSVTVHEGVYGISLLIEGTSGNDTIGVTAVAGDVLVYVNGTWSTPTVPSTGNDLQSSEVDYISVEGLNGRDWIDLLDVSSSAGFSGVVTFIFGGGGNDDFYGSAFEDYFFGGAGWDRFNYFDSSDDYADSNVEEI